MNVSKNLLESVALIRKRHLRFAMRGEGGVGGIWFMSFSPSFETACGLLRMKGEKLRMRWRDSLWPSLYDGENERSQCISTSKQQALIDSGR